MAVDKNGNEYIIVHNNNDTKYIIDLLKHKGKTRDMFYNQVNGKTIQENYNEIKRKRQTEREIEREIEKEVEKRVEQELEKQVEEKLSSLLEQKLSELLKGF